jgi:hypothetical protein
MGGRVSFSNYSKSLASVCLCSCVFLLLFFVDQKKMKNFGFCGRVSQQREGKAQCLHKN